MTQALHTAYLNARQHEQEAKIVADAGKLGHRDHRHQHGRVVVQTLSLGGNVEFQVLLRRSQPIPDSRSMRLLRAQR